MFFDVGNTHQTLSVGEGVSHRETQNWEGFEEQDGHNYSIDMLFALRYAKENRRRMMEEMKETVAEFVPGSAGMRTWVSGFGIIEA